LKPGVSNGELLQVAINGANIGYKARIPSPTQAGVETTVRYLDQHRQLWNPIYTALMTQIGTIVARHNSWTNPLARFKRGLIEYGNGIEEYQTGLIRAKAYDPNRSFGEKMAFGTHRVPVDVSFHEKNRMDVYPVSVERAVIKSAFLGEGDMSGLISDIMAAPSESDKWDEFLLMSRLFTEYERRGGFYHAHIPDISAQDVTDRDVRLALRKMRAMAGNLKFRSPYYNAAHFPIAAKPDNLVMFITPEANAALDVEGLAALFNVSYAEVPYHIIEVPAEYFPQGGCQAILVDSDFFVVADTLLENLNFQDPTEPSQENIFLHHHEIISCSRFVPAIMFWTGGETERILAKGPVTAITAIKAYGEGAKEVQGQGMVRGGNYQLEATCTGGGTHPDISRAGRGTHPPPRRTRHKERRHTIRVGAVAVHRKNREDSHHHEVHTLQAAEEARTQHIPEDYAQNPRHVNQHVHPQNARPRTLMTVGTGVKSKRLIAKSVNRQSLSPETLHILQREGNTVHQVAGVHEQSCEANSAYTGSGCDHFYD